MVTENTSRFYTYRSDTHGIYAIAQQYQLASPEEKRRIRDREEETIRKWSHGLHSSDPELRARAEHEVSESRELIRRFDLRDGNEPQD